MINNMPYHLINNDPKYNFTIKIMNSFIRFNKSLNIIFFIDLKFWNI